MHDGRDPSAGVPTPTRSPHLADIVLTAILLVLMTTATYCALVVTSAQVVINPADTAIPAVIVIGIGYATSYVVTFTGIVLSAFKNGTLFTWPLLGTALIGSAWFCAHSLLT